MLAYLDVVVEVGLEHVLDVVGVDCIQVIHVRIWCSKGLERAAIVGDAVVEAMEVDGMEEDPSNVRDTEGTHLFPSLHHPPPSEIAADNRGTP